MCERHGVSIRQGCKAVSLPRSTYRYRRKPKDDQSIIDELLTLVDKHPAIGFWQCYHRLRAMGHRWNHKRVYRVYTVLRLNIRRPGQAQASRPRQTAVVPARRAEPGVEPGLHARQPVGRTKFSHAQRH